MMQAVLGSHLDTSSNVPIITVKNTLSGIIATYTMDWVNTLY